MVILMVLESFPHDSYCKMNVIFVDAHWRFNAQSLEGQEMDKENITRTTKQMRRRRERQTDKQKEEEGEWEGAKKEEGKLRRRKS